MPLISKKFEDKDVLARILLYGKAKTRKTWWAVEAASAGYNVILADGDSGYHIIKNLSPEAQSRIFHLDLVDKLREACFAPFLAQLLYGSSMVWDETTKRLSMTKKQGMLAIDINKLTSQDVLVIDSWSALVASVGMQYNQKLGIDPSKADKVEWDEYAFGGRMMSWMLGQLSSLKCHVIVIAHMNIHERKEKDGTLISSTIQPLSFTNNHSGKLAQHFSDILYFYNYGKGVTKIQTYGTSDTVGGCRMLKPDVYDWQKLQIADVFREMCIPEGLNQGEFNSLALSTIAEVQAQPATVTTTSQGVKPSIKFNIGGLA